MSLQNLEQNLIIIKVQTGPKEKNAKYHSNVYMNIIGNTADDWKLTIGQCETQNQLKEKEIFWQHRLKVTGFTFMGLIERQKYLF